MKKVTLQLFFLFIALNLFSQDYPDLGLNGVVTWLDSTHVRVEYDWKDDSQLLDWSLTNGSLLVRGDGFVTITDGYDNNVRAMIWNQRIKCSRITAEDAAPLYSPGHLNFYSNLSSYYGSSQPNPGFGAVLVSFKNFWVVDGEDAGDIGAPYLVQGELRNYEYTVSLSGMTIKSSSDDVIYSYEKPLMPELDRKIALGGWGGDTRWGKIIIEGEVSIPWHPGMVPPDVINIQAEGDVFAPVIEVEGEPLIEWTFSDSTTSSSVNPFKDYGSTGSRYNYLKVTPWSALKGINVGYDASDGGYGEFDTVEVQNVQGFQNLNLASGLEYLCASYNPIAELDVSGLENLKFLELFYCQDLTSLVLKFHPVLERLCAEDCDLDSLDVSGCPGLKDLRAAVNKFPAIKWGTTGQSLWHICIRDNPHFIENIPHLGQFPVLEELYNWNTNQSGAFECHNPLIRSIKSYNNHYTSADVSNCINLFRLYFSGNPLEYLNLGTADRLTDVHLNDCTLDQGQVDYVLRTLDASGVINGYLDLSENELPSIDGLQYYNSLKNKGWIISELTDIEDYYNVTRFKTSVTRYEMTIWLSDDFINWDAYLYDINGIIINYKNIDSNVITFNASELSAGMYIIKITNGNTELVKKIIKP